MGILLTVVGFAITEKDVICQAEAAYWAGSMIATLSSIYLFECYQLYQKEFGL